jgi:hypothetical protein
VIRTGLEDLNTPPMVAGCPVLPYLSITAAGLPARLPATATARVALFGAQKAMVAGEFGGRPMAQFGGGQDAGKDAQRPLPVIIAVGRR